MVKVLSREDRKFRAEPATHLRSTGPNGTQVRGRIFPEIYAVFLPKT